MFALFLVQLLRFVIANQRREDAITIMVFPHLNDKSFLIYHEKTYMNRSLKSILYSPTTQLDAPKMVKIEYKKERNENITSECI